MFNNLDNYPKLFLKEHFFRITFFIVVGYLILDTYPTGGLIFLSIVFGITFLILLFKLLNNYAKRLATFVTNNTLNLSKAFKRKSIKLLPSNIGNTELTTDIGDVGYANGFSLSVFTIQVKNADFVKFKMSHDGQSFFQYTDIYDLIRGGQILKIGSNYFETTVDSNKIQAFQNIANRHEVKMIELNLNESKKDRDIDGIFCSVEGQSNKRSMFHTAESICFDLNNLSEVSCNKPIGLKLKIGSKKEFYNICYAIRKTGIIPDYMAIEGSDIKVSSVIEGKPNPAQMALYEAISFVFHTLPVYGLNKKIKIIAVANVLSVFDILKILALGADAVCTEMPTYRIVKIKENGKKESLVYKKQDLRELHENVIKSTADMMRLRGINELKDVTLSRIFTTLELETSGVIYKKSDIVLNKQLASIIGN